MGEGLMHEQLGAYLDTVVPVRPDEMQAMEEIAEATGFPVVGAACGHLCYQMARMLGARRVFELGSGYGYSTAWFARAVAENGGGEVYHVVWHDDLSQKARRHLAALGFDGIVRYRVGEAVETLRHTDGPFDLVFLDIDKQGYPDALPVIAGKLRPKGMLIADNMLWHGRVLDADDTSPETEAIRAFTRAVTQDPSWIATIVPIRDGLLLASKAV
jgi:caffeoyl-CoA O-methyltransferase